MAVELLLMIGVVLAIVIGIGPQGINYLVGSLKSRLTRSRKTKTDPTA